MSTSLSGPLITTAQLAEHIGDSDWAIIDCRFYLPEPERGEREYEAAHIPGAVHAHLDRDLSGPLTGSNGRHPLPSVEQMASRFSAWGIDDSTYAVAYDAAGGQMAARLWWMLRYAGTARERAFVLDGGWPLWREEGRPQSGGREVREAREFVPNPQHAMRVEVSALEPPGGLDNVVLVDARAAERYRGEVEPLDPVAGRIPGALNAPSAANLDEAGRFLSREQLRARFESLVGDQPFERVVNYCGSGVTACHNALAMEIAGLEGARLYPGSWSEWCAGGFRPMERG